MNAFRLHCSMLLSHTAVTLQQSRHDQSVLRHVPSTCRARPPRRGHQEPRRSMASSAVAGSTQADHHHSAGDRDSLTLRSGRRAGGPGGCAAELCKGFTEGAPAGEGSNSMARTMGDAVHVQYTPRASAVDCTLPRAGATHPHWWEFGTWLAVRGRKAKQEDVEVGDAMQPAQWSLMGSTIVTTSMLVSPAAKTPLFGVKVEQALPETCLWLVLRTGAKRQTRSRRHRVELCEQAGHSLSWGGDVQAGCAWTVWALVPSMDGGDAHAATLAAAAAVPVASDGFAVVLNKAVGRAFKGGVAGFTAGVMQVFAFMWLRTSMNYQYVNGGGLRTALRTLYAEGGVKRFYQGVGFAVVQAPLSRFGDTAANGGVLLLLDIYYPEVCRPLLFTLTILPGCHPYDRLTMGPWPP